MAYFFWWGGEGIWPSSICCGGNCISLKSWVVHKGSRNRDDIWYCTTKAGLEQSMLGSCSCDPSLCTYWFLEGRHGILEEKACCLLFSTDLCIQRCSFWAAFQTVLYGLLWGLTGAPVLALGRSTHGWLSWAPLSELLPSFLLPEQNLAYLRGDLRVFFGDMVTDPQNDVSFSLWMVMAVWGCCPRSQKPFACLKPAAETITAAHTDLPAHPPSWQV